MNDLITVIIPIYNVEQYLRRCVDSVLAQTYKNLEIYLVDDGSPDNCGKICDEYASKDNRIKVIHKKNGGLSDARNAALDVCMGEYISFIDSDDYVSEDFIESLYLAIKRFDTKLSICGINKFSEPENSHVDYCPADEESCVSGSEMYETVWRPSACNKMYHRSIFESLRYPFGKLYEDLFIYHDVLAQVDRIAFTGKNSYYYFDRPDSIINKSYDIRNTDEIEGLDLRINKLRELNCAELADRHLVFMFNNTVEAFVNLKNKRGAEKRLKAVKTICDAHFREMMSCDKFTDAQKVKISMFRYFPDIYTKTIGSGI